ncbi:MAG: hypothetical protein IKE27_11715 [Oscillospiraceae bacterium]|nr:hypothetical protein [Oscillospiraceae bacterium]
MNNQKLFDPNITPACSYCEYGTLSEDMTMINCSKSGLVSPYFRCRRFKYSPVKRVPAKMPKLKAFDPSLFQVK